MQKEAWQRGIFPIAMILVLVFSSTPVASQSIPAATDFLVNQIQVNGDEYRFVTPGALDWALMLAWGNQNLHTIQVQDRVNLFDALDIGSISEEGAGRLAKLLILESIVGLNPQENSKSDIARMQKFHDGVQYGDATLTLDDAYFLIASNLLGTTAGRNASRQILLANQDVSGGFRWGVNCSSCVDPDTTGIVLVALHLTGGIPAASADRAKTYLESSGDRGKNTQATTWIARALGLPELNGDVTQDLLFLRETQRADGGWQTSAGKQPSSVWATLEVVSYLGNPSTALARPINPTISHSGSNLTSSAARPFWIVDGTEIGEYSTLDLCNNPGSKVVVTDLVGNGFTATIVKPVHCAVPPINSPSFSSAPEPKPTPNLPIWLVGAVVLALLRKNR